MFYKISYGVLSFYPPSNILSFLSSLLRSYVQMLSCLLLSVLSPVLSFCHPQSILSKELYPVFQWPDPDPIRN